MTELARSPANIEKATMADFEALKSLLDAADIYSLEKNGVAAWGNKPVAYQGIEKSLQAGETYVTRNEQGEPTASISISETSDEWGQAGKDGQALYFSKFYKDRTKADPNDAKNLLNFCVEEAIRLRKPLLRCDIVADQPEIKQYYENFGFQQKGRINYQPTGREGILMEVLTSEILVQP